MQGCMHPPWLNATIQSQNDKKIKINKRENRENMQTFEREQMSLNFDTDGSV